jgi:FkbM family methyltransferase
MLIFKKVKHRFKALILKLVSRWVPPEYARYAYSQEGEDLLISRLLELDYYQRTGFYVDVGAHHPKRHSNTQYFYERGWRGMNVDASAEAMKEFEFARVGDVNITCGVGEKAGVLTFYEFDSPALNSFDQELSEARDSALPCKIINQRQVPVRTLQSLLEEYLPAETTIDFMSVDVEGLDLEVVRSNDWERFRPLLLLIEDGDSRSIEKAQQGEIAIFMQSKGYEFLSKTALTLFFKDTRHWDQRHRA